MSGSVNFAKVDCVGRIGIDNAARRNAFTEAMWGQLTHHIATITASREIRAVVLTGEGGHFSSGADIGSLSEDPENFLRSSAFSVFEAVAALPVPTIAAVQGACFGGGAALALACDMRFVAADAKVGITPARMGLLYDFAATSRLVSAVGPSMAKELLMTGRSITGVEAVRCGFATRMVDGTVEQEAIACAKDISLNAPLSVAGAKRTIDAITSGPAEVARELSRELVAACIASRDFAEGRRAFLERRTPVFEGR